MSDRTLDCFKESLRIEILRLHAEGKTDSEISENLTDEKIQNALSALIDDMSANVVKSIENTMFERVFEERAKAAAFMAHNEQIWFKGFVTSEAMYLMVIEAAEEYCSIVSEFSEEKRAEKEYRFVALQGIHGRACQQYLEILCLLKNGFADGAYARWRSLYELSVVADFISKNDEDVAKAFVIQSNTDEKWPDWAKTAPVFANRKGHIKFSDIEKSCSFFSDAWKDEHDLSCKLIHASPQGTFSRICNVGDTSNVVPTGHCDGGLALPAVNAALLLSIVSASFFNLYSTGDGTVIINTLREWVNVIDRTYQKIEEDCFPQGEDHPDPVAEKADTEGSNNHPQ